MLVISLSFLRVEHRFRVVRNGDFGWASGIQCCEEARTQMDF
jgi:hypothetical protein